MDLPGGNLVGAFMVGARGVLGGAPFVRDLHDPILHPIDPARIGSGWAPLSGGWGWHSNGPPCPRHRLAACDGWFRPSMLWRVGTAIIVQFHQGFGGFPRPLMSGGAGHQAERGGASAADGKA